MKLILTLFLSVFVATTFAYLPFIFSRLGKQRQQESIDHDFMLLEPPQPPCDNMTFWRSYYEKAKKEHPTASDRELVRFISHDLMSDSSDPFFIMSGVYNKDPKDVYNSHLVWYWEFYGTFMEFLTVPIYPYKNCNLGNNISFVMFQRHNEDTSENELLNPINQYFPFNDEGPQFLNLLIKKQMQKKLTIKNKFGDDFVSNCTKLPHVQEVIDKIDKMKLPNSDVWCRAFIDEFTTNPKIHDVSATKSVMNPFEKYGFISESNDKLSDMLKYMCDNPLGAPYCHSCQVETPEGFLHIDYIEH